MIEFMIGLGGMAVGGAIAYGDLRAKIGRLEGKMELISKNVTIIMNNNNIKKEK